MFKQLFQSGGSLVAAADAARDSQKYLPAARLYEKYLRTNPGDAAIHVQCGHMFKEAGQLSRAELHYDHARQLTPDDPDLALQLGHFYKVAGRLEQAEIAFRRAIELAPDWPEPAIQLGALYRAGWRNHTLPVPVKPNGHDTARVSRLTPPLPVNGDGYTSWERIGVEETLVPELAPQPPESKLHGHAEEIVVRWWGHYGRTHWGMRDILRGVEAIRGYCVSAVPIVEIRASLNGLRFFTGAPKGYPLKYEKYDPRKKKYVFNIWHDFSHFQEGLYEGRLHFVDENGGIREFVRQLVIYAPLREEDLPNSDRLVSVPPDGKQPLEEWINSRPSMIRPAKRAHFMTPPRSVLVQRVDQLGDLVVSIPALRRLRELLPEARLVGLLSLANADLARTLDIFDEIIAIDFPDDEWEQRRTIPLDKQHELRRRFEPYKFDVAIDLAESDVSRPLLLLSGARYLAGFKDERSTPWLSAYFEGITRDPRNGMYEVSPSAQILALVEWFGTMLRNHAQIVQRDGLLKKRLISYELSPQDRFAVLHTGARLKFSHWPHYNRLAAMILDRTDLKVVMMSDDPLTRAKLLPELGASQRFQLIDKRLPFDDFDAFLSFCMVFVGNDSGPAHLASLRGANVVNLFLARHNWNEWGHENRGYIISRRVPCAGCNIHHEPEECGRNFPCITHITPDEVFHTVAEFL